MMNSQYLTDVADALLVRESDMKSSTSVDPTTC